MSTTKKLTPTRLAMPLDGHDSWYIQHGNMTLGWALDGSGMSNHIWTSRAFAHARGKRSVMASFELSEVLATLAATKVGRKAMLDAITEATT